MTDVTSNEPEVTNPELRTPIPELYYVHAQAYASGKLKYDPLALVENCPGLRNTRGVNTVYEVRKYQPNVDIFDPWANPDEARIEYDLMTITQPETEASGAIVLDGGRDEVANCGTDGLHHFTWAGT